MPNSSRRSRERRYAIASVSEIRPPRPAPSPAHPHAEARPENAALIARLQAGDDDTWAQLITRFDGMIRRAARSYRLQPSDVDDVAQTTWLSLIRSLPNLRESDAIAGWLKTTAHRAALRIAQARSREQLCDDIVAWERPDPDGPELRAVQAERRAVLADALTSLPDRHRRIVVALTVAPPLGYAEISAMISVPVGSIGPIRARSLARLARHPRLRALAAATAAA
jgi:RNA polymerase sigma factor (sigma-70 family)